MSIKVMSAIWESSPSKENKLLALLAIADNADDNGWAYPSQNKLAVKCRVKRRAMQKILDVLEADGEVIIYNRVDPNNREQHFSNVYHLARYGDALAEPPHELRGLIKPHVFPETPSVQKDTTGGDVQKDTTVVYDYALPSVSPDIRVAYPETHESLQEPSDKPSRDLKDVAPTGAAPHELPIVRFEVSDSSRPEPPSRKEKKARVSPHEPEFIGLVRANGLDPDVMRRAKTGAANYWSVAADLHRIGFPVARIGELYAYVKEKARREQWSALSVNALGKYAPEFLRDDGVLPPEITPPRRANGSGVSPPQKPAASWDSASTSAGAPTLPGGKRR
jgi:hypothetical protein